MGNSGLVAKNLIKFYGDKTVLKGITLEVKRGEIVGFFGTNGAGKTTTFKCLIGFEKPDKGDIVIDGKKVNNLPPYKRARLGLAFLPQEHSIIPELTVFENIFMFAELYYKDKETAESKTESLLQDFELLELKDQKAGSLSGGEKRRLELARLFLKQPKYILLDEPFAGVDPKHVQELKDLLEKIQLETNRSLGFLITDHNVWETLPFVDRAYIIYKGEIIKEGKPKEVANDPWVRKYFLGQNFTL
jgi:lipopolysaccharide export system ATP-binding protein